MTDLKSISQSFTSQEIWRGGHYGIEFDLGEPSDERLSTVLQAIWPHPSLVGCYLSHDGEMKDQIRVEPRQHPNEGHFYGTAILPNGLVTVCGTYVSRIEDEAGRLTRDVASLYAPLGCLSNAYPVGAYPFSDTERAAEWRRQLDQWLVNLGRFVFGQVPFQLALVGFEVDFPNVTSRLIEQSGVPVERYDGFLWRVGDRLEWYPPTNFELIRVHRLR